MWVLNTCHYLWFFCVFFKESLQRRGIQNWRTTKQKNRTRVSNQGLRGFSKSYCFKGFKFVVSIKCLRNFDFCPYLLFFLLSFDSTSITKSPTDFLNSFKWISLFIVESSRFFYFLYFFKSVDFLALRVFFSFFQSNFCLASITTVRILIPVTMIQFLHSFQFQIMVNCLWNKAFV